MANKEGIKIQKSVLVLIFGLFLVLGIAIGVLVVRVMGNKESVSKGEIGNASYETGDYDVLKCIKLGDYKGMKVSISVEPEDIEFEVESLIEDYTTYEQLTGIVADGDMVYANFEGYIDGKRVDDTCGSDYVTIGSGEWLEGFEEGLTGVKTGEATEFVVSVPDGVYGDPNIDGKDVTFKATVEYICGEEVIPEYNDEFVQSISEDCKTTEEYDQYLKEMLTAENEEERGETAWSDLMLICTVNEYPEELMKKAKEEVLQGYYDMAKIYNYTKEEIFVSMGYAGEEEFCETELEGLAKDTVQEYLLAEALAKTEGISYTDAEYQSFVAEEYQYNTDVYDTQEEYEEASRFYLQRMVLQNAVKTWLAENVTFIR